MNKYGNRKTSLAGYSFASKGEADCFRLLQLMEKAKEIKILGTQVSVYLTDARIQYISDFLIYDKKIEDEVYLEFKGFSTDVWNIKKRLWKYYGPKRLRIFKGSGLGISMVEEIIPR